MIILLICGALVLAWGIGPGVARMLRRRKEAAEAAPESFEG